VFKPVSGFNFLTLAFNYFFLCLNLFLVLTFSHLFLIISFCG
jgi:hypothetical protein